MGLGAVQRANESRLEGIQILLGKVIRSARRGEGRPMQEEDQDRVQAAMDQVAIIIDAYREGLFEQAHSVRVKRVLSDLRSLESLLGSGMGLTLTEAEQERVRTRVKTWSHETRWWVAYLPLQGAVRRLPGRSGVSGEARAARLTECWEEAGADRLIPPPRKPTALPPGLPGHFQMGAFDGPRELAEDPLDALAGETGKVLWTCRPGPLLELLGFAEELLLLEVGGPDRGGRTTFVERRRRASLKDAFALSCLVVFEQACGPKTARQSQTIQRATRPTNFEEFLQRVHEVAFGGTVPRAWALGPDPIRKAIATQRAWQKILKLAECADADGFNALPLELQLAAERKMKEKDRRHLRPPAPPLV